MSEEQDWPMRELIRSEQAHQAQIEQLRAEIRQKDEAIAELRTQLRRLRDEYRRFAEGEL